jgi:hypothetical protein
MFSAETGKANKKMIEAIRYQQRYADRLESDRHSLLKMQKVRTEKATIPDTTILKVLLARNEEPRLSKASLSRQLRLPAHTVYNILNRYDLVLSPAGKPWYRSRGL